MAINYYYAIQIFHELLKVKILKYDVNLGRQHRSLFRSLPSCYLSMSPEIQYLSKNQHQQEKSFTV